MATRGVTGKLRQRMTPTPSACAAANRAFGNETANNAVKQP